MSSTEVILDPFVQCNREETGENVPKIETSGLRNDIISKLRTNKGNMIVKEFIDIVNSLNNLSYSASGISGSSKT